MQAEIIYRDKDIIAVCKPAGMASQPDRSPGMDLVNWLKNTLAREEGRVPEILPVHRLDRPVGGVILYAGNRGAAARLSAQIREKEAQKEYLAVLTGRLPGGPAWQRMETLLVREEGKNRSRASEDDGKAAVLEYRVLAEKETEEGILTLVRIRLLTGRHHQIRVQTAHAGAGIWGDTKYNPAFSGKKGWYDLALFAKRLSISHPRTGKRMVWEVPAGEAITAHFPETEELWRKED